MPSTRLFSQRYAAGTPLRKGWEQSGKEFNLRIGNIIVLKENPVAGLLGVLFRAKPPGEVCVGAEANLLLDRFDVLACVFTLRDLDDGIKGEGSPAGIDQVSAPAGVILGLKLGDFQAGQSLCVMDISVPDNGVLIHLRDIPALPLEVANLIGREGGSQIPQPEVHNRYDLNAIAARQDRPGLFNPGVQLRCGTNQSRSFNDEPVCSCSVLAPCNDRAGQATAEGIAGENRLQGGCGLAIGFNPAPALLIVLPKIIPIPERGVLLTLRLQGGPEIGGGDADKSHERTPDRLTVFPDKPAGSDAALRENELSFEFRNVVHRYSTSFL